MNSLLRFLKNSSKYFLNNDRDKKELAKRMLAASSAISSSASWRPLYRNLWDSEVRVFSQWGEDGILNYLLDLANISKPCILEFGASNFNECNSRFAAEFRNASIYAVDMREDLVKNVEQLEIYWRNHIYPVQDIITPASAVFHMSRARKLMDRVDVLSIDLDGNDYWILDALDLADAQIVICEYNPLYGSQRACTVIREDSFDRTVKHHSWLHFGMSLRAAIKLMERSNLIFVGTNRAGNNAFFVRMDVANKLPFEIPNMKELDKFTDWRVRESRGSNGKLNFLGMSERRQSIADCELYDLESNSIILVKDL